MLAALALLGRQLALGIPCLHLLSTRVTGELRDPNSSVLSTESSSSPPMLKVSILRDQRLH